MKGTFESLLALDDTSPDLAQNSSSSLRTLQEEGTRRGLPPVQSFTSLDSLVLDDTVQFLPAGDLLCSGAPSPSPSSLLFPKVQPPALSQLGPYPPEVRQAKIARYKAKMNQRRAKVRVSRHFAGRSCVARGKTRVKGKFVRT